MAYVALNSLSLEIKVPSALQVQGGYLSHGEFISCVQGNRQSLECPSSTGYYLSDFNSKQLKWHILHQPALDTITLIQIWLSISETRAIF